MYIKESCLLVAEIVETLNANNLERPDGLVKVFLRLDKFPKPSQKYLEGLF